MVESMTKTIPKLENGSVELNNTNFRLALKDIYLTVIIFFGTTAFIGTLLNCLEIYIIIKNKYYEDEMNIYYVNLAIADIVKCIIVMPLSLIMLLFRNWILGEFLCYFLPILQDVPVHVTILTMLMVVIDRYLFIRNPSRSRFPSLIFCTGIWLIAVCIALPYPIYTTYVNLENFPNVSHSFGSGICLYGIEKGFKKYSNGIFIGMFILPLVIIGFLFSRIFQNLDEVSKSNITQENQIQLRTNFQRYYDSNTFDKVVSTNQKRIECLSEPIEDNGITMKKYEFDLNEQKRIRLFLIVIVVVFTICFGPLNTLSKIIFLGIHETYDISFHLDIIFVTLLLISLLPTIITPLLIILLLIK